MTRSASRGTSSKVRTMRASRRPPPRRRRHRGPHARGRAGARNSSTRRSSSSGTSTSPSASSDLAVSRLHAQQPHPRDYGKGRPRAATMVSPPARRVTPTPRARRHRSRGLHRRPRRSRARRPARRPAELAQAVADRGRGGARAPPARRPGARRRARGAPPASTSACSPSRGRRRRGGARPGARAASRPSTSRSVASSRCPPVTMTAPGPSAWIAARELLGRGRASAPSPASTRASGRLGVTTVARGRISADQRVLRVRVEQPRRRTRRPSPGPRRPACPAGSSVERLARPPRSSRAVPSMPTFTASTPRSSATARTCATIMPGETASTRLDGDGVLRGDRRDRRRAVDAGSARTP